MAVPFILPLAAAFLCVLLPMVDTVHQPAAPTPAPSPSPPSARGPDAYNCTRSKLTEVLISPLNGGGRRSDSGYIIPARINCSTSSTDISEVAPVLPELWKTHVVMACTIAAAIEIVLVIIIVLYWRQIRWTLRKLTCPCECCRRGQHEPMEQQSQSQSSPAGADQSQHVDPSRIYSSLANMTDPDSDPEEGPAVQIFVGPRRHVPTASDPDGPGASYSAHSSHSQRYS